MTRTRVKICGLTRPEDVAVAVAAGADAVGFILAPSSRQVNLGRAAELAALVPWPVERVGVFVDAAPGGVAVAVEMCGLTAVQFAGSESPDQCAAAPVPVIKSLHVAQGDDVAVVAEPYRGKVAALLLDTYVPGEAGGTGRVFDWQAAAPTLPDWAPVFVAGGLGPGNVAACVAAMRPFGVDVSSGVEAEPGIKDASKIVAFCEAVSNADEER